MSAPRRGSTTVATRDYPERVRSARRQLTLNPRARRGGCRTAGSSTAEAGCRRGNRPARRTGVSGISADSLIRRRAALNIRNAIGSSTNTAEATLSQTSDVPRSSTTSNQASQHSSVPVTSRQAMTIWRPRQNAQPVAANASSRMRSKPDPGALPVLGVEGAVQGKNQHDDPGDQHGAGRDRDEDTKRRLRVRYIPRGAADSRRRPGSAPACAALPGSSAAGLPH